MTENRLLTTLTSDSFARKMAIGTGIFRVAAGSVLLANPDTLARLLGVDSVTARRSAWLTRMIAGREAGLGLGALSAARTGRGIRPALLAQAVADTADAAALLTAARSRRVSAPRALGLAAFAVAGVAGEVLAAGHSPAARRRSERSRRAEVVGNGGA